MKEYKEQTFGRYQGANVYMELVLSYPELLDRRVVDIARQAAHIAIDAHTPDADNLVPSLVAKAIVGEIKDMTFEQGRFARR